jgi:transposase
VCPVTVLPCVRSGPIPSRRRPGKESTRWPCWQTPSSSPVGVDTHKHTHTAAVVVAATGAVIQQVTVPAAPAGYQQLLKLASQQPGQRVWAIEGTGGYGAGLTRFLHAHAEQVVELDRPKRTARRHGPSPTPWMRSGPPARPWAATSSPSQGPLGTGRRCRCGCRPPLGRPGRHRRPTPTPRAGRCCSRYPPQSAAGSHHASPGQHLREAPAAERLGHRDHRNRGQPARPGAPHPAPRGRGRRAHPGHHCPGPGLAPRAPRPHWGGPDRGRRGAVCLVPSGSLPDRCRLRHAGRGRPDPCLLWSTGPGAAQPVRRSSTQPGLHVVVLTRLRYDPATRAYAQRRRAEGKTNREIRRCLVRYVARQLYRLLEAQPAL